MKIVINLMVSVSLHFSFFFISSHRETVAVANDGYVPCQLTDMCELGFVLQPIETKNISFVSFF